MGSLVGICGRVFREPEDNCLEVDAGRVDGASPEPGLDIMDNSSVNHTQ